MIENLVGAGALDAKTVQDLSNRCDRIAGTASTMRELFSNIEPGWRGGAHARTSHRGGAAAEAPNVPRSTSATTWQSAETDEGREDREGSHRPHFFTPLQA